MTDKYEEMIGSINVNIKKGVYHEMADYFTEYIKPFMKEEVLRKYNNFSSLSDCVAYAIKVVKNEKV